MKKGNLCIMILLLGSIYGYSQTNCAPQGINTSGVEVASIIMQGIKFIPTSDSLSTTFHEVIPAPDDQLHFELKATDNGVAPTDYTYWRVYLDLNDDQTFSSSEIYYESGLVLASNTVTGVVDFREAGLPDGSVRTVKVVMSQNQAYLNGCITPPTTIGYLNAIMEANTGGRRIAATRGGSGKKAWEAFHPHPFIDCLPLNDTLEFWAMGDGMQSSTNITIEKIELIEYDGNDYDLTSPLTTHLLSDPINLIVSEIYDANGVIIDSDPGYPFDIGPTDLARIKVPYESLITVSSGTLLKTYIYFDFNEGQNADYFVLAAGCCPNTSLSYNDHSSDDQVGYSLLPPFSGASLKIEAGRGTSATEQGVMVSDHTSVVFRSDDKIILKKGFKALKGSRFLAYINPCDSYQGAGSQRVAPLVNRPQEASFNSTLKPNAIPQLKVYPNPVEHEAFIAIQIQEAVNSELIIYNGYGQVIAQKHLTPIVQGPLQFKINTRDWPAGIYSLVWLQQGKLVSQQQIAKVR